MKELPGAFRCDVSTSRQIGLSNAENAEIGIAENTPLRKTIISQKNVKRCVIKRGRFNEIVGVDILEISRILLPSDRINSSGSSGEEP